MFSRTGYCFLRCTFGNLGVFPNGVLFSALSVRELVCFSERGIVPGVIRSGIWVFSRTGCCFLRHSFGYWGVFPNGVLSPALFVREFGCFPGRKGPFGILGAGRELRTAGRKSHTAGREPRTVGSKCMQVVGDSFSEKDILGQVFLFLDFLFLKRETGVNLSPFHYLCGNDFWYEKDFLMPVGNGFCGGWGSGTAVGEEGADNYGA